MFQYKTHGTCSQQILIDVNDDDVIENVQFIGGCTGNTQGVSRLIEGMKIDDVIAKCKGIQCRAGTSCPDQLATALEEMKQKQAQT